MPSIYCKYCGTNVELVAAKGSAFFKDGEKYLPLHNTPFDKPCILGTGESAKDNEKPLINESLWVGLEAEIVEG